MKTSLRSGALAVVIGIGLWLNQGCSSSSSGGFGSSPADAGLDSSIGTGGSTGTGGVTTNTGGTANSGGQLGSGGSSDSGLAACAADGGCATGRCDGSTHRCVECLFDNECADGARCVAGACQAPTPCSTSRDCRTNTDGRSVCSNGVCAECALNADCPAHQLCAVDTCVDSNECTPPDGGPGAVSDCKAGQVCGPDHKCAECAQDTDCTGGKKCSGGTCRTSCASDNACVAGNQLCDLGKGICVDCTKDSECDALHYCSAGSCAADVCAEGVKSCAGNAVVQCNANGSGILAPVPCTDGKQCEKKGTNATCEVPRLADGGLPAPATCNDKQKNGDEADTDCGGSCPKKCADGAACNAPTDCTNSVCEASCSGLLCFPGTRDKKCRPAACSDNQTNGDETDKDCGGGTCPACAVDDHCGKNADCESNICKSGKCAAAPCTPSQCFCLLPTDQPCCLSSGQCGCATVFPFKTACQ